MRTRTVIIALLALVFAGSLYSQEEKNYSFSEDKKTITVWGDCTINVEEIAPGINIYGDKEKGGIKRTKPPVDLFKEKTDGLNKNHPGVAFQKNPLTTEGFAQIVVTYAELVDELSISFYIAEKTVKKNKDGVPYDDWSPKNSGENTFSVTIVKKQQVSTLVDNNQVEETEAASSEVGGRDNFEGNNPRVPGETPKPQEPSTTVVSVDYPSNTLLYVLLIIVLIVLGIVVFFLFKIYSEQNKELKRIRHELHDALEGMHEKGSSVSTAAAFEKALSGLKTFMSGQINTLNGNMNKELQMVQSQIAGLRLQTTTQSKPQTGNPVSQTVNSVNEIDTDIVHYNPANNSFTVGGTSDHIFRIYSKKGEYYYTIVSDNNIRREIIAALSAFENCITVQSSKSGSMVVPITDGRLLRNGNNYMVDTNHKLIVGFE